MNMNNVFGVVRFGLGLKAKICGLGLAARGLDLAFALALALS